MTIVLTGASGFVGRQILRALLVQGCSVRAVVRDPGRLTQFAGDARIQIFKTEDLFQEPVVRLEQLLRGADAVIHTAWYAEPGEYLTSLRNIDCLKGTLALARAFVAVNGKRFVGVGSCAEYDLTVGDISVDTPLVPQSLYAACKASAFQVLQHYLVGCGVSFAWCRLFYLYGEGEDERRLIPYLRRQLRAGEEVLLTRGEQVRDFLDVAEAGRLIAAAATSEHQGAINICSGEGITVRELAESVADEYGRRELLRFGARAENLFDPARVVGVPGGAG